MLVLKRKIGETLLIGEDVEITLLEKDGDSVKIGIEAPRSVRIFRKEVYEEIKAANQSALRVPGFEMLRQHFQQNLSKKDEK